MNRCSGLDINVSRCMLLPVIAFSMQRRVKKSFIYKHTNNLLAVTNINI